MYIYMVSTSAPRELRKKYSHELNKVQKYSTALLYIVITGITV